MSSFNEIFSIATCNLIDNYYIITFSLVNNPYHETHTCLKRKLILEEVSEEGDIVLKKGNEFYQLLSI